MGTRPVFKFCWCSIDFIMQKVYFSRFMWVCTAWLYNVNGVYLVQISLLLIGQQGLGHFLRYRSLLPIGWRIVQIFTPTRAPGENDKIKQITLLSQRKREMCKWLCKIGATAKKIKNQARSLFMSRSIYLRNQNPKTVRETVLLKGLLGTVLLLPFSAYQCCKILAR